MRIYLIPLLLALQLFADLDRAKIEKIVKEIQSKRVSERKVNFYRIPSPMAIVDKNKSGSKKPTLKVIEKKTNFNLIAIINGRAYINGEWVKVGSVIDGFKVKEIKSNEVLLEREQKRIYLFLPKKRKDSILQVSEVVQ